MMGAAFIDSASLAILEGRCLFYPSAGCDWSELLVHFGDQIEEFHFCDITYDLGQLRSPFADTSSYRLITRNIRGNPTAQIEWRQPASGRPYRDLEPSLLKEVYERADDTRRLTVIRRRGFGQYALAEFADRSIAIFVHRGDSPGESGSNVFFLANKKLRHEPLSKLFDKLTQKLANCALIISDGSNVKASFLKKFHNTNTSGTEAFAILRERHFQLGAFDWTCAGYIGRRYGPTLIWLVRRKPELVRSELLA